jgi:CubicO group peptidase (beta-lactamase class C family)
MILALLLSVAANYQDDIPRWMADAHVPGLTLAVIEHGKVAQIRSWGVPENALFNVASLTKPIVTITTLRLVDRGQWSLDDPIDPYWIDPDLLSDPRHSKLTTRIILSHETGFPNWRRKEKLAFKFDPGTQVGYSGEGFEYLRRALEKKTGRSLQQLATAMIFGPAHMSETTFGWSPSADAARFAVPHDSQGKPIEAEKMSRANAADWLVTTIGDYSRFAEFVLAGAGISLASFEEMQVPRLGTMSIGWESLPGPDGEPRMLIHTGSDDGIKTLIVLLPKSQRGLVVFTNGENGMQVIPKILKAALNISP